MSFLGGQADIQVCLRYNKRWKDVRSALDQVEKIRQTGQDARVEVINAVANTTLRITFRSTKELDEYFNSHLRRLILDGFTEDSSCVSGRIILP